MLNNSLFPVTPGHGFGGIHVIENPELIAQLRFPTTKNRRIRKKWAKRKENWGPSRMAYYDPEGGTIAVHPSMAAKIYEALAASNG